MDVEKNGESYLEGESEKRGGVEEGWREEKLIADHLEEESEMDRPYFKN